MVYLKRPGENLTVSDGRGLEQSQRKCLTLPPRYEKTMKEAVPTCFQSPCFVSSGRGSSAVLRTRCIASLGSQGHQKSLTPSFLMGT